VIAALIAHADLKDTMLYAKVSDERTAAAVLKLPREWAL
jgi:hypothetical protein